MIVLGIESSCDECSVALVKDGRDILANVVATQIDLHRPFNGVVPELASRIHTEWMTPVVNEAFAQAGVSPSEVGLVAAANRPGLMGSLLVGLSFAKSYAWAKGIPFVGVDHVRAHLYAAHLDKDIEYPYIGLLVSGGHSIICKVSSFEDIEILGTTIDDAVGEAFDKVAKYYELGYPGGVAIDRLAKEGDENFFNFPAPNLYKGEHRYDVSYSGLKNAVINQIEQFRAKEGEYTKADIAASFQKRAVNILLKRLFKAVADTGINKVVAGGGVAANSRLRAELANVPGLEVIFPPLRLCTDNGAMIAGIGYHYYCLHGADSLSTTAQARVSGFRRVYP